MSIHDFLQCIRGDEPQYKSIKNHVSNLCSYLSYKFYKLATLNLNVSFEITIRTQFFFQIFNLLRYLLFFNELSLELLWLYTNKVRLCLSTSLLRFATSNIFLLKSLVKWLVIATKFLDCTDNISVIVRHFFMGVLISLDNEFFMPLEEACISGDIGIKHFKSPLEVLGEQGSMMDCRLFKTFWAAWLSAHLSCSNTSTHWKIVFLKLFSLLVFVLIFFNVSSTNGELI